MDTRAPLWNRIHAVASCARSRAWRCVRRATLVFAFAGASLGAASSAWGASSERGDASVFRVWLEPPLGGVTLGYGESPSSTTQVHLAALSFALELPSRISFEAGGGGLVSSVGGEPGISVGADAWAKVGVARIVGWRAPGSGWDLQLASSAGYRYMERGKIVFEDYGVDVEGIHALGIDAGPVLTHWSEGGPSFAFRIVTGVILPFTRTHSRANTYLDYPLSELHFAIPIEFDVGLAF